MATINGTVWLLIKEHADPQRVFDQYVTVYQPYDRAQYAWLLLYYAVQTSHRELVQQILLTDKDELIKTLCALPDDVLLHTVHIVTALNEAIRRGDVAMAQLIISLHPSIVQTAGYLYSSESAASVLCSPLELAIYRDCDDILRLLVEHFNWEFFGHDRTTLLHYAVTYSSPKSLRFLLSLPQALDQINVPNEEGFTPLLLAARYEPGFIQMILEHGGDINAVHDHSKDNVLQSLCRGSMRPRKDRISSGDPCPQVTLRHRPRGLFLPSEHIFIVPNFVELARYLVEKGINVNDETPPLRIFCENIRKKLQDLLGDDRIKVIYKEAILYLSSVTDRQNVDACLLTLCHQLLFICTQLRRCSDYDNIMRHIDLMELIQSCINILLDNGARPNGVEHIDEPVKRMRGMQYMIPFNIAGARELKGLLDVECQKPATELERRISTVDIILGAILVFYPVQLEEPEIHTRGLGIILEIFQRLAQDGARCHQMLTLFISLAVDPNNNLSFLDAYLDSQSQSDYHDVLSQLFQQSSQNDAFAGIQNQLSPYLMRMFSLKDLLRRDIIRYLGSGKCPDKVEQLPLPAVLKRYLQEFWETKQKP